MQVAMDQCDEGFFRWRRRSCFSVLKSGDSVSQPKIEKVKALSHDMTCANISIWNYSTKLPDYILTKSLDPMKLERRRHLEFANVSPGLQPMSAMMLTTTQC